MVLTLKLLYFLLIFDGLDSFFHPPVTIEWLTILGMMEPFVTVFCSSILLMNIIVSNTIMNKILFPSSPYLCSIPLNMFGSAGWFDCFS